MSSGDGTSGGSWPIDPPPSASPSLAASSVARLASDAAGLAFSFATGVVTARLLGPSDKGILASISFVAILFSHACALGLGEAAMILCGRRRATAQEALSGSLLPLAGAILAGAVGLLVTLHLQFRGVRDLGWLPVVAAVGMGLTALTNVLSQILNVRERVRYTSGVLAANLGSVTLATVAFTAVMRLSLAGAVLAFMIGSGVGFLLVLRGLRQEGLALRPAWNPHYARPALRSGVVIGAGIVLMAVTQRVDQLLVLALTGTADAGEYSVALSLAQLIVYPAIALSVASFSRLTRMAEAEASALVGRLLRTSLIGTAAAAGGLALLLPAIVPRLFGPAYKPAVAPATVLLIGSACWSVQWLLCRALSARGHNQALFWSFGAALTVMVAMDFVLIPRFAILGAAIASVLGSAIGMTVAFGICRRHLGTTLDTLVPRRDDVRALVESLHAAIRP